MSQSPANATRLVQIQHPEYGRRIALVNDAELHLLSTYRTLYAFAMAAIEMGTDLRELLSTDLSGIVLNYDDVYDFRSAWTFLPVLDHPRDLTRCLVSGCANGVAGSSESKPEAPPWFYKGNGQNLRGHGEPLTIPSFASGGAEEAELVGLYVIGPDGSPFRIGITVGSEFADPALASGDGRMLSHAKLRNCSIGPEVVIGGTFDDVTGSVSVERDGKQLWSHAIKTGWPNTRFTLDEVEQHHFKYDVHRIPGDAHVHFLGGSISTNTDGVKLQNGDEVTIQFSDFGRPLRNPIEVEEAAAAVAVRAL